MREVDGDVFTIDEVARAVGVPVAAVRAFVASGGLQPVASSAFFAGPDVVRCATALRDTAVITSTPFRRDLSLTLRAGGDGRSRRYPMLASTAAHALLVAVALAVTSSAPETAPAAEPAEQPRLVFLSTPGVGGGGGGSGRRERPRPQTLQKQAGLKATIAAPPLGRRAEPAPADAIPEPRPPVAAPATPPPASEPETAPSVVAPVAATANANQDRDGVVAVAADATSHGSGAGGREGNGRGDGLGDGRGSGLDDGEGGGTGGGPYRPGSGIQPPRLLREVKAEYTDEARRLGISGDVLLEIVVRRDGSVGEITIARGLGHGLDARAVTAVRQWQFAPARRLGAAVDVIVEVSVEFKLR